MPSGDAIDFQAVRLKEPPHLFCSVQTIDWLKNVTIRLQYSSFILIFLMYANKKYFLTCWVIFTDPPSLIYIFEKVGKQEKYEFFPFDFLLIIPFF